MRIAALYDIHANLPALEAVLDEVRDAAVDCVVIGGDVFPGPMPCETLDRLLDLPIPVRFLRGNGDRVVLAALQGASIDEVPEQHREPVRWVARQLSPAHERVLAGWPATLRLAVDGLGDVLFCHATPRSDTELFTRLTPEADVLEAFAGCVAPAVVCGHTHMQFDRAIGGVRVVNAGSVGMPFGEPGAYWLLLGADGDVTFRRTTYDLQRAADRIRDSGYPQAVDFASRSVLQPPTEAQALAAFSRPR